MPYLIAQHIVFNASFFKSSKNLFHPPFPFLLLSNPALEKRIDALRLKQQHTHRQKLQAQVDKLVATGSFTKASAERFLRVNEVVDETADDELNALLQAERPAPVSAALAAANKDEKTASVAGVGSKLSLQEELGRRMAEMEKDTGDIGGSTMVALGDASIASPFTSKQPSPAASPAACLDILRQVRFQRM